MFFLFPVDKAHSILDIQKKKEYGKIRLDIVSNASNYTVGTISNCN